jgi:hypothetical protein
MVGKPEIGIQTITSGLPVIRSEFEGRHLVCIISLNTLLFQLERDISRLQ